MFLLKLNISMVRILTIRIRVLSRLAILNYIFFKSSGLIILFWIML